MTEIEKVSIGGYAFTLEKAAAEEVGQYLKNLEAHYLGKPGGKEIMEGIEERMAELLLERRGRNGVATMADIQSLIGILGRPERIEGSSSVSSRWLCSSPAWRKGYGLCPDLLCTSSCGWRCRRPARRRSAGR